jgi:hypothetical protein
MSEHAPRNHESQEQLPSHEKLEAEPARHERHEKAHHAEKHHDVAELHNKIEKEAKSAKETRVDDQTEKHQTDHYLVTKEVKKEAYRRNLQRARKHMTGASRGFSKVIHQPVVDTVSKVGEKTIARPTGILTGAIIALGGSTLLLWSSRHYGYQYNYLVLFMLFAGGYILGLIIETLIYTVRRLRGR